MKTILLLAIFLLAGCSANYTTESFVYQDKQLDTQLDLNKIRADLAETDSSAVVSAVSLISEDGITLRGIKLIQKDARINIVFFSANGMKIKTSSKILNKFSMLPANVIWFDYRGVGISDKKEELTIDSLQKDALSIYDFSKNSFPINLPIAIHGLSMGSLMASYVATQRETEALILDGAISTVPRLVDDLTPTWTKFFYSVSLSTELSQISNRESIKKYNKPLLFLIGDNDSTTPVENSKELFALSPSKVKVLAIIPEAKHGETMKKDKGMKAYQDFIHNLACCNQGKH